MTTVAVIGNTVRNIGAACAADLILAGHEVRYHLFPDAPAELQALRQGGGFEVRGDPGSLLCGRIGRAAPHAICDHPAQALERAEVVLLDVPIPELEHRFESLVAWIEPGAVVYVQSFGYWVAARLNARLRAHGRGDIVLCEAAVPTHTASRSGNVVSEVVLRRDVEIASVPADRGDAARRKLRTLFPHVRAAPSVLQTSLESVNLMVHPAMALLGIGLTERSIGQGREVRFYRDCNVPTAGRLAEAMDEERGRVCRAYGVRHRTLPEAIDHYYGTRRTDSVHDAVLHCAVYQSFGPIGAHTWRDWESVDVPYAVVPLVRLAEQAGIDASLHRALAEILGRLLDIDPRTCAPSLEAMGLTGPPREVARRFAAFPPPDPLRGESR